MGARLADSTSSRCTCSRLPRRRIARPPAARTLRTQLASLPSIDTRHRSWWYSTITTRNGTRWPVRRPATSSVAARAGDSIPAEDWTAAIRSSDRAMRPAALAYPVRSDPPLHPVKQVNRAMAVSLGGAHHEPLRFRRSRHACGNCRSAEPGRREQFGGGRGALAVACVESDCEHRLAPRLVFSLLVFSPGNPWSAPWAGAGRGSFGVLLRLSVGVGHVLLMRSWPGRWSRAWSAVSGRRHCSGGRWRTGRSSRGPPRCRGRS